MTSRLDHQFDNWKNQCDKGINHRDVTSRINQCDNGIDQCDMMREYVCVVKLDKT